MNCKPNPFAMVIFAAALACFAAPPSYLSVLLALAGICASVILIRCPSEWLEDAFGIISSRLKIPGMIAGALFLAASSSAPEFFTSLSGVVFFGIFEVGIITILWSSIFNICIIIGSCAMVCGKITFDRQILKRDIPFMGLSMLALIIMGLDGLYTSLDFFLLIIIYFLYIGTVCFDTSEPYTTASEDSWFKIAVKIIFGLVLIGVLSHSIVSLGLKLIEMNEVLFHFTFPVSLISMLIYAPATSFPDLFMSVSASKRGEGSVAVVNGVGSNTFDITMCIGIPGLIYTLMKGEGIPISIPDIMPTIIILLISCLLIIRCALSGLSVNKNEGLFLCLFYLAGMVFQILRLMPPS